METAKTEKIPAHVALILDGNGRWAKKRGLPRSAGHKKGSENVDRISRYAFSRGVKVLSFYVFSTENWKRPESEVKKLFSLLSSYLKTSVGELKENDVSLVFSGDLTTLPEDLRELCKTAKEKTAGGAFTMNLCLNYGGRQEIARAASLAASLGEALTTENIEKHLYTAGFPDPDLVIRTSGEQRLSNFMPYQTAYSEFYFTDVFWPDFDEKEFDKALLSFAARRRRYGGIDEEE